MKKITPIVILLLSACGLHSWQGKTEVTESSKYPNATEISYFKPDSSLYSAQTKSEIVTARRITIETNSPTENAVMIEKWLRQQGATGMIEFTSRHVCQACSQTNVYLVK